MKVVRLSALRTGRPYSPGDAPGTHFCYRLSRYRDHSAAGRIKSNVPKMPTGIYGPKWVEMTRIGENRIMRHYIIVLFMKFY